MATNTSGSILGHITGTLGSLTLANYKGKIVAKSKKGKANKRLRKKLAAAEQAVLFKRVNYLLRDLRDLFQLSFRQNAKVAMTPFNVAVSANMLKAFVDEEGHKFINLSKVQLSKCKDPTQQLWNAEVKALPGQAFSLTWELNPFPQKCTQTDDLVHIVYCSMKDSKFRRVYGKLERSDLSKEFTVKSKLVGHEVFIYVVVISADSKRVAVTDCLGMLTVLR
jgi:hypothetical protein